MARSRTEALPGEFYDRPVVEVAAALIGCTVAFAGAGGFSAGGVIVETEAYHESEPACHAFAGLTPRTRTLFGAPGRAYVYCSYGVHALLNAVCEPEGVGAAVLIRALQPLFGIERMRARRAANGVRLGTARGSANAGTVGRSLGETELCSGPGKLTQALGIRLSENGGDLHRGPIRICAPSEEWEEPVVVGTRVGITKAVELPWRFCVAGNRHVSRPRPRTDGGVSPWRGARAPVRRSAAAPSPQIAVASRLTGRR
jgi:DNA-3-methyladenine glycosylase